MISYSVRYCGTCNPVIDVDRLSRRVELLARRLGLVKVPADPDILILINGCEKACGSKAELPSPARGIITIAGATVDFRPVKEEELPSHLEKAILHYPN